MVLKIRLARFGKRNAPFYNIVVAQARYLPPSPSHPPSFPPPFPSPSQPRLTPPTRSARNSKPLEVLGTYDPIPKPPPLGESGKPIKDIKLDTARAKYWLGVGAQPSDTAWRLLSMVSCVVFLGMGMGEGGIFWEGGGWGWEKRGERGEENHC
jgi:small subunit ribosomal protein S16